MPAPVVVCSQHVGDGLSNNRHNKTTEPTDVVQDCGHGTELTIRIASVHPSTRPPPCLASVGIHVARTAGPSVLCHLSTGHTPLPFPEMCHCVSHVQLSLFLSLSRVELLSAPSIGPNAAWEGGPALGGAAEGASHNPTSSVGDFGSSSGRHSPSGRQQRSPLSPALVSFPYQLARRMSRLTLFCHDEYLRSCQLGHVRPC